MDFDKIIAQNSEKSAKKIAKMKETQEKLNAYNGVNTRNIQNKANVRSNMTQEQKDAAMKKATEYYNNGNAKPGSLMARASMVKQYNEKNNKDNKSSSKDSSGKEK